MRWILLIGLITLVFLPNHAFAATSEHLVQPVVINTSGTTTTGVGRSLLNSIGESITTQTWGESFSIQSGFFNDYFILPATPTVTATVTVTSTPIRTFNGELLAEDWVYAAPNPIRGHVAHVYYNLAETAEVEIKVFATTNQLVISQHWNSMPAGQNNWDWNVSNIANGVYIVLVKAKNGNRTTVVKKKIALVK